MCTPKCIAYYYITINQIIIKGVRQDYRSFTKQMSYKYQCMGFGPQKNRGPVYMVNEGIKKKKKGRLLSSN